MALLQWLVAPGLLAWGDRLGADYLRYIYFGPRGPPWLLITLGVAWLPVVPFLASDVWRLLLPLMPARATKLHLPFALASLVVALGAVLLIRHHAIALFAMFGPPTSTEL